MEQAIQVEMARKVTRPVVSVERAEELALLFVGAVKSVKPLNSYDDANFLVVVQPQHRLPLPSQTQGNDQEDGWYILKVHNGEDSEAWNHGFLDAMDQVMLHLATNNISANVPFKSKSGVFDEFVLLPVAPGSAEQRTHAVRFLSFVKGKMMCDVSHSPELLFDVGAFVAQVDSVLSTFEHPHAQRTHFWDVANLSLIRHFSQYIGDAENREIVAKVLTTFETEVVPQIPQLRHQVVHNDGNDHNIVMDSAGLKPAAVIDFGDIAYTPLIFGFAVAMSYALLDKEDLHGSAKAMIQGYVSKIAITPQERALLHTLVCCRMAQSVTMGSYSFHMNPQNTYLLVTAMPGWTLLKRMLAMSKQEIDDFNGISASP